MNLKYLIIFFNVLILGNILIVSGGRENESEKAVYNVLEKVSQQIEKKCHMKTDGTIIGMPEWVVRKLGLCFRVDQSLSKDNLRIKLMYAIDLFLKEINSNEEIRPFLKNYPFSEKNIEINIFVFDKDGNEVLDPNIGLAASYDGCFVYRYVDKDDRYKYSKNERESYEEAVKLIESNKIQEEQ